GLALEALQKAIDAAPADPADYLRLAALHEEDGDPSSALALMERLLAEIPRNPGAEVALAQIQLDEADAAALERASDEALKSNPRNPRAHYIKAVVLRDRGDMEASLEELQGAAHDDSGLESLVALVRAQISLGHFDEADAEIQRKLERESSNRVFLELLRDLYLAKTKGPLSAQKQAWALEHEPVRSTTKVAYQRLILSEGLLYEDAGNVPAAIQAYEDMLTRYPENPVAANNLARLLVERRGDDPASLARARALSAILEDTNEAAFLDTAGWVLYRSGSYERAVKLLERAVALDRSDPERQYHLGMAYLKLGRTDEAKALLPSAVASEPPFPVLNDVSSTVGRP
ncbi:MAG: tetratricopeptide repeat protein, partial [Caldilineaceae bacterium]